MPKMSIRRFQLKDGRRMEGAVYTYPIPLENQVDLIRLWQTEWNQTDFDWLESMRGDYSEHLTIKSVLGKVGGELAGTASVSYPCGNPEIAVVGNVLTHPAFRCIGISQHLTEWVVELAFDAGCEACFLGTTRGSRCVYLRCGFDWWNGGVMCRFTADGHDFTARYFAAGQQTFVRDANWGDLPGTTCLVIQPLDHLIIDYPRGLLSCKHVNLHRCVSNFPALWYGVRERRGAMGMLIGETAHRVLGVATMTPGPAKGQSQKAVIDVVVHDNYEHQANHLFEYLLHKAGRLNIESLQVYVASCDITKRRWCETFGMRHVATLPSQVKVGEELIDVTVLERSVKLAR